MVISGNPAVVDDNLSRETMTPMQWVAVATCVFLNAIDGFDILAMATATPTIQRDLSLSKPLMGTVLSASLVGMMVGAMFLSALADRFGRRPVLLACLTISTIGMALTGLADGAISLGLCRLLTGIGVGGTMPVLNTLIAELTSTRRRNLAITAQAAGYPLGGLIAAIVGSIFIEHLGWRGFMQVATIPSALGIAMVVALIPESVPFLLEKRPHDALARINRVRARLGQPALRQLPDRTDINQQRGRIRFEGAALRHLLLFATATFMVQFSFYFFLSWLPSILEPHLHALSLKSAGAIMMNLGGIAGDILFGMLCLRVAVQSLTLGSLMLAFGSIVFLEVADTGPTGLVVMAMAVGGFLFAAMAGIYATAPRVFPPLIRSAGTGITFSVGRLGGALSPWIGGIALAASALGTGPALILMAVPLLLGAFLLVSLERALKV